MSIKRRDTLHFFAQLWESPDYVIVKGNDRLEAINLVAIGFATIKKMEDGVCAKATKRGRTVGDAFFMLEDDA